jgi:hypothetical protein
MFVLVSAKVILVGLLILIFHDKFRDKSLDDQYPPDFI